MTIRIPCSTYGETGFYSRLILFPLALSLAVDPIAGGVHRFVCCCFSSFLLFFILARAPFGTRSEKGSVRGSDFFTSFLFSLLFSFYILCASYYGNSKRLDRELRHSRKMPLECANSLSLVLHLRFLFPSLPQLSLRCNSTKYSTLANFDCSAPSSEVLLMRDERDDFVKIMCASFRGISSCIFLNLITVINNLYITIIDF